MGGRRVLITGGSGFIGTNAVEHTLGEGDVLLSLDVAEPRIPGHRPHWLPIDILDRNQFSTAVADFRPTHVVHLAARTDLEEKKELAGYASNIEGVENLMAALKECPSVERLVVTSTHIVCRHGVRPEHDTDFCPDTLYGASKVETEKIVRREGESAAFAWTIFRPISIWGPWFGRPYMDFFLTVQRRRYLHPGRKQILRSTGYVGNTVHHIFETFAASRKKVHGKVFYTAFRDPVDLLEWANLVSHALGVGSVRSVPVPLLRFAAKGGDLAQILGWQNPPLTSFRLRNMLTETNYDTDLTDVCGPEPYNIEKAVELTAAWMRQAGLIE